MSDPRTRARPPCSRTARARTPALLAALCATTAACATLDGAPRAARGSADCARAAVREVVTPGMYDKRAHCLGAAQIVRRCSVAEARLAIYGKEFADTFDGGDPEARDIAAGRRGIACARARVADVSACCAAAGW